MSKVSQSQGGPDLAEAAQITSRHNQVDGQWAAALKQHPNCIVEIRYPGKPPVRVSDRLQFDLTLLRGASGFSIIEPGARSDRKGGVVGTSPLAEGSFANAKALPSPTKSQIPKQLRASQRLGRPAAAGALPKSAPASASARPFGPFNSATESRDAQRALTRLGYGEVATTNGSWGPKSDKALAKFMTQYGITDRAEAGALLRHLGDRRGVDVSDSGLSISHPELGGYPGARTRLLKAISSEVGGANNPQRLHTLLRELGQLDDLAARCKGQLMHTDVSRTDMAQIMALTSPTHVPGTDA